MDFVRPVKAVAAYDPRRRREQAMKFAASVLGASLLSFAISMALGACSGDDDECNLRRVPPYTGTYELTDMLSFEKDGDYRMLPFSFSSGQIKTTEKKVVITYVSDGKEHQVVYDVLPNE
jgi:hypothetical protein